MINRARLLPAPLVEHFARQECSALIRREPLEHYEECD